MRIKFNVGMSGPDGVMNPGDEVDWKDSSEAKRLIDAGIATAVSGGRKKKTETTTASDDVETADA